MFLILGKPIIHDGRSFSHTVPVALKSDQVTSAKIKHGMVVFKILMTSKDAECLRGVLRAYSTQNVQMRISLRDESDWWKHDSHAERYVVDMPNGNSVCVVYDFVDCSTNTILYVAVIPF